MDNDVYLKDVRHESFPNEKIYEWEFIDVKSIAENIRVYFKPIDNQIGNGFYFYVFIRNGYNQNSVTIKNPWHHEHIYGECIYEGTAYWDGIRHLYMGSEQTDNFGYSYYANLTEQIEILQVIRDLEKKYCKE